MRRDLFPRRDEIRGERKAVDFGSQIRSYVLAPYQMVKDHRTNVEVGDPQRVLDGDLERFIEAELRRRASAERGNPWPGLHGSPETLW